jgi:CubicO group peptidase (beta-lactamase class C family)
MRRGAKVGPETPVYDALAGMGPFANPDPLKARLTVAHLLTHTSGLACDDNDEKSPGNEDTMSSQTGQPDWWKYTLDLPQAHEPGVRYSYCSANSNLVGAVLKTATKTSLPKLFDRWVARPLDFGRYYWNLMPTGEGTWAAARSCGRGTYSRSGRRIWTAACGGAGGSSRPRGSSGRPGRT